MAPTPSRLALAATMPVVAYAWWATALRPFSSPALLAVEGAGVAAIAVGARRRRRRPPSAGPWSLSDRGVVAWGALVVVLVAWEVAAYLQSPRADHPTLSSLANTALESHPARAVAFLLWLVAGAELARR